MTPRRASSAWRWLRRLVLTLAALELIYLIVGNSFLRQDWGRALLSRKPAKLTASWQSAWTVVPGYVHLQGLALQGTSVRVAWRVRLDRGTALIWLPSLLTRHLHFLSGDASGAEIDVDVLPPPERPRRHRWNRGWRVTLAGLRVGDLRRIRIGRYELSGDGSAHGWCRFQVRGPMILRLRGSRLAGAELARDGKVVARELDASVSLRTTPFFPGQQPAREFLRGMTGSTRLKAQVTGLGFETADLRTRPWLGLNGSGRLDVEASFDEGAVQAGSKLTLQGSQVAASFFDFKARGSGRLEAEMPQTGGKVQFGAVFDDFHLGRASDGVELLQGSGLEAKFSASGSSFTKPPSGLAGSIRLPPSRVDDLAALNRYLPEGMGTKITAGSAKVSGQLQFDLAARQGEGQVEVDARDVSARLGDAEIHMNARLGVKLDDLDLVQGRADLSGSELSIRSARIVRNGRIRAADWNGDLHARSAAVSTRPSNRARQGPQPLVRVGADVRAELLDSSPLVVLMEQRLPKLAWLHRVLTFRHVDATGRVTLAGPLMRLSDLHLIGGPKDQVEMRAELDLAGKKTSGAAYVRYRRLDAAIALNRGDRDWRLRHARQVYRTEAAAFRNDEHTSGAN